MNFSEYQTNALRTEKLLPTPVERLVHASLGLCTESGEVTTEVKRMAIYGKLLDEERKQHIAEEIGDVMWYLAIAADAIGMQMGDIAEANIAKLKERFPDKYTNEAAEARADKGGLDCHNS